MKKKIAFLALALLVVFTTSCKPSNSLSGSWCCDQIVFTFDKDSLYIDEINNEGDCYKYYVSNGIITYYNDSIPYPEIYTLKYEIKNDFLYIQGANDSIYQFRHLDDYHFDYI